MEKNPWEAINHGDTTQYFKPKRGARRDDSNPLNLSILALEVLFILLNNNS